MRETAIHVASQHGNSSTAQLLINAGANINLPTRTNHTALHYAIAHKTHKYAEVVHLLLQSNCDLDVLATDYNAPPPRKVLPIEISIQKKAYQVTLMLLQAGCSTINHHYAAANDQPPIPQLPAMKLCPQIFRNIDQSFLQSLIHFFDTPRPLQSFCRIVIRRLLGRKLVRSVASLQIPLALKHYITMRYL